MPIRVSSTAWRASRSEADDAARAMAVTTRSTVAWSARATARWADDARCTRSRASWLLFRSASTAPRMSAVQRAERREELIAAGARHIAPLDREGCNTSCHRPELDDLGRGELREIVSSLG